MLDDWYEERSSCSEPREKGKYSIDAAFDVVLDVVFVELYVSSMPSAYMVIISLSLIIYTWLSISPVSPTPIASSRLYSHYNTVVYSAVVSSSSECSMACQLLYAPPMNNHPSPKYSDFSLQSRTGNAAYHF